MANVFTKGLALLCLALCLGTASANEATPAVADPVLEARMLAITAELRCLVCQNQTIADSHADLAIDLRQQVREMLLKGMTDQQIAAYMTERYGDFVLYRPPFKGTTALLWIGPGVLLVLGLLGLVLMLRRRSRMPEDRFDIEEPEGQQDPHVPPAA
jgi:cytochrome c-type biogenesis protein CcmH